MRVWLDDRRPPRDPDWVWVKTPEAAIELLASGGVTEISLDHDLGLLDRVPEATGYDVVLWIERQVATEGFVPPEVINVHSSNSSAAPKMERGIASIRRLYEQTRAS
jgi:putative hemolysin